MAEIEFDKIVNNDLLEKVKEEIRAHASTISDEQLKHFLNALTGATTSLNPNLSRDDMVSDGFEKWLCKIIEPKLSSLLPILENNLNEDTNRIGESIRLAYDYPYKGFVELSEAASHTWHDIPSQKFKQNIKRKLEIMLLGNTPQSGQEIPEDVMKKLPGETLRTLMIIDENNGKNLAKISIFKNESPAEKPKDFIKISRKYTTRRVLSKKKILEETVKILDKSEDSDKSDRFIFTKLPEDMDAFLDYPNIPTGNVSSQTEVPSNVIFMNCTSKDDSQVEMLADNIFERISDTVRVPVHWLQYENGKLVHMKSKGSISTLQKCICNDQEQNEVAEEDMLQKSPSFPTKPILICGGSGIGKTVELTEFMGHLLHNQTANAESNNDSIVIFATMREFVQEVKMNSKNIKNEMESAIKKALAKLAAGDNELGKWYFANFKINSRHVVIELLLDAFNEIDPRDSKTALESLSLIKNSFPSIRLWATTKPNGLIALEDKLSVFAYNLSHFQEADEIKFLTDYWIQVGEVNMMPEDLKEVAVECLKQVKKKLNSEMNDCAKTPLQCLIIAQAYQVVAKNFSLGDDQWKLSIKAIPVMYEACISSKFQTYREKYGQSKISEIELMLMHVRASLELLYPAGELQHLFKPLQLNELINFGLMESSGKTFIHVTFPMYFIAWYVAEVLKPESNLQKYACGLQSSNTVRFDWEVYGGKLTRFVLKNVLACERTEMESESALFRFTECVTTYFLNSLLDRPEYNLNPKSLSKYAKYFADDFKHESMVKEIFYACAVNDRLSIFKLLVHLGAFKDTNYAKEVLDADYFFTAIKHSSKEFVEFVFKNYFRKYQGWGTNVKMQTDALSLAVRKGAYPIVQYMFVIEEGLKKAIKRETSINAKTLIHECVKGSMLDTEEQISDKIKIIRKLARKRLQPNLLSNKDEFGLTPLLCLDVHIELTKELIELGANVLSRNNENDTVLHFDHKRRVLSCQEYYDLLEAVLRKSPESFKELMEMKGGEFEDTPLLRVVREMDPTSEILNILKENGANFKAVDKNGKSILVIAEESGRAPETIEMIRKQIEC